jgi:AraC-like DNA-binding protein
VHRGNAHALETGDVVVVSRGDAHVICDRPATPTVPLLSLPAQEIGGVRVVRHGVDRGGAVTRVICGRFHLDHVAAASFVSLLPEVLVARRESVGATLSLLDTELGRLRSGSAAVVTRLCDLLFVELLRSSKDEHDRGWVAALADPVVAKALALVHADPSAPWDAASLAAKVGMSRSRFFARFSKLVGEPPARYLARWRMSVAADELRRRDIGTAELADLVGYGSEEAFSRMFKRHMGMGPRAYRKSVAMSA